MNEPLQPQANVYPGYGVFMLEERNGRPQDSGAQYRITAGSGDARLEDPAYPRYRTRHAQLEQAVDEVRERLEARRRRLLEEIEGCDRQLSELESFYRPQPTPGQQLQAQRPKLVALLRRFKETGRGVKHLNFDGFSVALPYLNTNNLFVLSLPEYSNVNPRFLASDVALLREVLAEAGYENCTSWNGEDCYSVSFQLPVGQDAHIEEDAEASA